MMSVADFITVPMNTLSFLSQIIEEKQTIVVEEDSHPLDWDRLRDANDDYDSVLFYPEREVVLKDGEFVLVMPPKKEMVSDESHEDVGDDDQQLI